MKTIVLLGATALAAFGLSGCVTTQSKPEHAGMSKPAQQAEEGQRRQRVGGGHSKDDFYASYDRNGDGKVTEAEFYEVRNEGFDARDADKNGDVVADEYVSEYEVRLEQDLAERRDRQIKQAYVRFGILDGDKNGVMSRDEFQSSGKRMFGRLDTNKDGVVDEKDSAEKY